MPRRTALVLFNRDLRVHDHPALQAAAAAERTVPLFVLDEALLKSRFAAPNRVAFMRECLVDLDESLGSTGARLFVRQGGVVEETMAVARECAAEELHVSADWSAYARRREGRLRAACEEAGIEFTAHPGTTIAEPGAVTPTGGDHFKAFTPYFRAWSELPSRTVDGAPRKLSAPADLGPGRLPALDKLTDPGKLSAGRAPGGETEGRKRMHAWLEKSLRCYEDRHDDLPADDTSHLSPYLRFGCVSALELIKGAQAGRGGEPFVRQLCWRDFHHQVLAATPSLPNRDYRTRGDRWSRSERAFEAWREGKTGS